MTGYRAATLHCDGIEGCQSERPVTHWTANRAPRLVEIARWLAKDVYGWHHTAAGDFCPDCWKTIK